MNNLLLSCDWGTSSFRLRLVDLDTHAILDEIISGEGISATYEAWEKHEELLPLSRPEFYNRQLRRQIDKLINHSHNDLEQVPLVISGMASSALGLSNLAYATLPFDIDGSGLVIEIIESTDTFQHDIYLISGVRNHDDVMRGEETQLIGVIELLKSQLPDIEKESILIFPGTHSKHVTVKDGKITNFHTYVTGELFALMSRKSILKESVTVPDVTYTPGEKELAAFRIGVQRSQSNDLLRALFTVRTNNLFATFDKRSSYYYLSGLVIGAELRELAAEHQRQLILCSGSHVHDLYRVAMEELMIPVKLISGEVMDLAVVEGQIRVFQDIILSKSM